MIRPDQDLSTGDPLVSIIVPTFGRPELLETAIRSVISQTYDRWELLVIDDNGEGRSAGAETQLLLDRYLDDGRIRYLRHEANLGGSQARNTGISAANGEYIAFLDDDDEWLPHKLELQCGRLRRLEPDHGAVYCGYYVESAALSTVTPVPARSFVEPFPRILVDNFIGTTSTLLCRKSVFDEVGMFDTKLPAAQDRELLVRICRSYRLACIHEPLVRFNWHDGIRVTKQLEKKLEAQELIYSRYQDELRRHPALHTKYLVDQAKLQLQCGQAQLAAKTFLRAWLASPLNITPLIYSLLSGIGGSFYEWIRSATWKLRRGSASKAGRFR